MDLPNAAGANDTNIQLIHSLESERARPRAQQCMTPLKRHSFAQATPALRLAGAGDGGTPDATWM